MTTVLAIDPGETTGLAWAETTLFLPAKLDERISHMVSHGQIHGPCPEQVDKILRAVNTLAIRYIVIESFQNRPRAVLKGSHALDPVRIDAMLEFSLRWTRVELFRQTPAQGKSVMTDPRLKALGLWWPGEDHARDAARHLVAFVRRVRQGTIPGVTADGTSLPPG